MSPSNGETLASQLAVDTILQSRYRIVRPLGKGGMGAVYEALDQRLDQTVAIKETFSTDDQLRRQFEREARMLAHLQHPSLPRVSDYFTEGDRAFLVMQFVEGVDLARIMAQQPGPFPLESVVAWADQLLDALIYLHSRDRQVIHRDIKPHNLKLTPQGQIALLDFGLAKAQRQNAGEATSSAAIFGYTKQYAPLEQIQDSASGPQSDIYALGATLYHLLTGVKPPDALTRAAALVQARPDPLRPANEVHWAIGAEIAGILQRAMAQNPEDRYASAVDFRNALRRVGRTGLDTQDYVAPETNPTAEQAAVLPGAGGDTEGVTSTPDDEPRTSYRAGVVITAIILLATAGMAIVFRSAAGGSESKAANTARPSADSTPHFEPATTAGRAYRLTRQKGESGASDQLDLAATANVDEALNERVSTKSSTAQTAGANHTAGNNPLAAQSMPRRPGQAHAALKVPAIRLPIPDLQRNYSGPVPLRSATSDAHPLNYGPPAEAPRPAPTPEPREPQILRARDGTQIVKYPDGSTRVFRPGERSLQNNEPRQ